MISPRLIFFLSLFLSGFALTGSKAQSSGVILEVSGIDAEKKLPLMKSQLEQTSGIQQEYYCTQTNTVYFEVSDEYANTIQEHFHSLGVICYVKKDCTLNKIKAVCNTDQ
jgi:hypothetical protein